MSEYTAEVGTSELVSHRRNDDDYWDVLVEAFEPCFGAVSENPSGTLSVRLTVSAGTITGAVRQIDREVSKVLARVALPGQLPAQVTDMSIWKEEG